MKQKETRKKKVEQKIRFLSGSDALKQWSFWCEEIPSANLNGREIYCRYFRTPHPQLSVKKEDSNAGTQ